MKLMKRMLCVAVAGLMIASSGQVTYARSTNSITRVLEVNKGSLVGVNPDGKFSDHNLVISPNDGMVEGESFYIQLNNAEWASDEELTEALSNLNVIGRDQDINDINVGVRYGDNGWIFRVYKVNEKELRYEVERAARNQPTDVKGTLTFRLGLAYRPTGGVASLSIIPNGTSLSSTEGKEALMCARTIVVGNKGKVSNDGVVKVHKEGAIGTIRIQETEAGAFNNLAENGDNEVRLELSNGDYYFTYGGDLRYLDGFNGVNSSSASVSIDKNNPRVIYVKVSTGATIKPGTLEINKLIRVWELMNSSYTLLFCV